MKLLTFCEVVGAVLGYPISATSFEELTAAVMANRSEAVEVNCIGSSLRLVKRLDRELRLVLLLEPEKEKLVIFGELVRVIEGQIKTSRLVTICSRPEDTTLSLCFDPNLDSFRDQVMREVREILKVAPELKEVLQSSAADRPDEEEALSIV